MFNKNFLGGAGTAGNRSTPSPEESCNVLDEESSPIMNVLLSGDHRGRLMLRLFDGFDMETVSLSDLLKAYGSRNHADDLDILKADIQLDLSEITILACVAHVKEGLDARHSRRLVQITLYSRLLDNHAQEIRMLGLHKRPMENLLQYLSDGLQVMKADFNKISQMAEDCVESLQKALSSNDGRPSDTMVQFLDNELSTHDLKRWDKSAKAAYKNLQRVAFECLLPACERLLVIHSDSLGCSRWSEQYGPLRLEETLIYNCIIIAGDFLGVIERLFQAIKIELKQFTEFENWLEQVLEKLHPPARGPDDPTDEGLKNFPLIDVKGVSQYVKAGLVNSGLAHFFQEADETLTTNGTLENAGLNDGNTVKVNKEEALSQSYNAIPSYPIVFSFSDDLRTASTLKTNTLDNQSSLQKKSTNPFAGAAIAAAMAGRGFGLMSSKKSPSTTLFTKSSASNVQSFKTVTTNGPGSPIGSSSVHMTLEQHLMLMTTRCLAIFQGPQKALAESMKVVHMAGVLECESITPSDTIMEDVQKSEARVVPKFATRYSYHTPFPWHYLVICLQTSEHISESYLVVLRSRKAIHRNLYGRRSQKADTAEEDRHPTLELTSRKRKAPPTNNLKWSQSNSETLTLSHPVDLSSSKSASMTSTSTEDDKSTELPGLGESVAEQDMEVAIFSLQEHDSAQVPFAPPDEFHDQDKSGISDMLMATNDAEPILALAKVHRPSTSEPQQPFFEVRDLTFLDDDSLCVLLNSSRLTVSSGTSGPANDAHEDQFVVSVPLLTPSRPYQSLRTLLAPLTPSDDPQYSVLDRLVHAMKRRPRDGQAATSSLHNAAGSINVYTLPIDRSRCVTPLDGQSAMDVDGASRSFSFLKSAPETILDTREQQQQQDDGQTRGPTRIACNDREKGQVISVHSHNKINVLDVLS
ncbi:hypothetical protein EC991_002763 [Linnemannia zychae]|nr:hypothetical protein EC991_002763 [Linnemannia zychae]